MKKLLLITFTLIVAISYSSAVFGHCEIPCGIYGDKMRIAMIEEDITTIETSMRAIVQLSGEKDKNYNQLVRWINNKDVHANKIQETVYQYFMAQRVRPADAKDKALYDKYVKQLTLLHKMIISAMKAKQTTDLANCTKLRSLLKDFKTSYFTK